MNIKYVLGAIAVIPALACAAESPRNISREIQQLSPEITSITVVAIDPYMMFVAKLSEAEFRKWGCSYEIRDPAEIAALVEIVARGEIVETPPFYKFGPDPRLGIYMQLKNGKSQKLQFTGVHPMPKAEYGLLDDAISIIPKNVMFAGELRNFIVDREPDNPALCKRVRKL